jgi:hypothetical protein
VFPGFTRRAGDDGLGHGDLQQVAVERTTLEEVDVFCEWRVVGCCGTAPFEGPGTTSKVQGKHQHSSSTFLHLCERAETLNP